MFLWRVTNLKTGAEETTWASTRLAAILNVLNPKGLRYLDHPHRAEAITGMGSFGGGVAA